MSDAFWKAFGDWPGLTLFICTATAVWYFVSKEVEHRRKARFNIAISNIYPSVTKFVDSANRVNNNINTFSVQLLIDRQADRLDGILTFPLIELKNNAIMIEMFFAQKDREGFDDVIQAARDFNVNIGILLNSGSSDCDIWTNYDNYRIKFNEKFNSGMTKIVTVVHDRLLGGWEDEFKKIREPSLLRKLLRMLFPSLCQ